MNVLLLCIVIITYGYYTALLSAVERSALFQVPSPLPVVNYFLIITVAKQIMAAVKQSGVIHVFRITPQVVRSLINPSVLGC